VGCALQCKVTLPLAHFGESEVVGACVRVRVAQHSIDLAESVVRTILEQLYEQVYEQVILKLTVSPSRLRGLLHRLYGNNKFTLSAQKHTTIVEQKRASQ